MMDTMYASGGFINISLDGESKEDYGFVLIEPVENESILTNEMGGSRHGALDVRQAVAGTRFPRLPNTIRRCFHGAGLF